MNSLTLKSCAKINITLDIIGRRSDGYHDLKMIMQSVSLCDNIHLKKADTGIFINSDVDYLPCDETNHAHMAAKEFFDYTGITGGVEIFIEKRIPIAAGLAGGSGNAAAVLVGLNRIYDTKLSNNVLLEIGLKIGSDVPYCISGGTKLAEGRGEILTEIPAMAKTHFLLVTPPISVSTKKVFSKFNPDELKLHPDTVGVVNAIKSGNSRDMAVRMYNVLENALNLDIIDDIKAKMIDLGADGSVMSGSGPTVIGVFRNEKLVKHAESFFSGTDMQSFAVINTDKGVIINE